MLGLAATWGDTPTHLQAERGGSFDGTLEIFDDNIIYAFYFKEFTTYLGWKRQWQAAQEREGKPVTPGQWMEQNTEVGLPAEYKMIKMKMLLMLLTGSDDLLGRGVGGAGPGVGEGRDGDGGGLLALPGHGDHAARS